MSDHGFGWPVDHDFRYDRRVDDAFVALFEKGEGLFRSLSEYARRARYPVDLQFRRDVRSGAQRAVLYVGLQCALRVDWRPGLTGSGEVRLTGHSKMGRRYGFEDRWADWMPLPVLDADIDAVENYLERVIPKAAASATEGAVQAAATSFDSDSTMVLDREWALQFRDEPTKRRIMQSVSDDIVALLVDVPVSRVSPTRFGGRCDLFAVDDRGLLAVEVKPRNVSSIVWAPAQAIVYARLMKLWVEHDESAQDVISWLGRQRTRLALGTSKGFDLPPMPFRVTPVLAIQRGATDEVLGEMQTVLDYLRGTGIPEAHDLELATVSLSGRLIRESAAQR